MTGPQWHEGPELTVAVGLTDEERRVVALQAAAASWAGISAVRDRDTSILNTAARFLGWLTPDPEEETK